MSRGAVILPEIDPSLGVDLCRRSRASDVEAALASGDPGLRELAALLSPAADAYLEPMAQRAREVTRRHFGRTVSIYAPLYLSSHCPGGCVYCGFASDRRQPRLRLGPADAASEMQALRAQGLEDILLLTGERTAQAGFSFLEASVRAAASRFHHVGVESFAMSAGEYRRLVRAGCSSVTLYQETYDARVYRNVHRWGPKRDYGNRLDAPARALAAGARTVGLGVLLGLADPIADAVALFRHARHLQTRFWRGGIMVSFPRLRPEAGGFLPFRTVSDRLLARVIFAFRLCLPDVHLVLSTREAPGFRDSMAGLGISRMSAGSRTTVGGYARRRAGAPNAAQFLVHDTRSVRTFCRALRRRGLEPVFKNWDAVFLSDAGLGRRVSTCRVGVSHRPMRRRAGDRSAILPPGPAPASDEERTGRAWAQIHGDRA